MQELSEKEAKALGFEYPRFRDDRSAVLIDEVSGATIAGLFMDGNPQREDGDDSHWGPMVFRVVLLLTDGRTIVLTEEGQVGYMQVEFGTLEIGANP